MDARTCAMLNGANSRMLSRITKRTVHEEASSATRTFDVIASIRARRHQWVGHILRLAPDRMIYMALKHMHTHRSEGDLLMDTPPELTWDELVQLASGDVGRDRWRQRVCNIANGNKVIVEAPSNTSEKRQSLVRACSHF